MKAIKWVIMAFLCVLFSNNADKGQSGQDEPDVPPVHALVYCSAAPKASPGNAQLLAALRDIDLLRAQSLEQAHDEEYYKSLPGSPALTVSSVNHTEIRFAGVPQVLTATTPSGSLQANPTHIFRKRTWAASAIIL